MPKDPATTKKDAKGQQVSSSNPKLVRDSFTFPEDEYAQIAQLKQRIMKSGRDVKKSEILRAGISVLTCLTDAELLHVLEGVAQLKRGRPAK